MQRKKESLCFHLKIQSGVLPCKCHTIFVNKNDLHLADDRVLPSLALRAMHTVAQATVKTLEEIEDVIESSDGQPVVVQIESEACARCPGFVDAIRALTPYFEFKWLRSDVCETELTEVFGIHSLPAFIICTKGQDMPTVVQNATPRDISNAVQCHCRPRLTLNEDF